jgi:hypothetical protein
MSGQGNQARVVPELVDGDQHSVITVLVVNEADAMKLAVRGLVIGHGPG